MTDAVDPGAVPARPKRTTGINFPPPVFRAEGQADSQPAEESAPAPPIEPVAERVTPPAAGSYWTQPAPMTYTGQPIQTAGMPAFMTPRGVASLSPPMSNRRRGGFTLAMVLVVLLAGAAIAFGIVELARHNGSSTKQLTLPATVAGHPLNPNVSSSGAKNSVEVLLTDPVKIGDFVNSASYGFYGDNTLPDVLLAAGPTGKISAQELTVLATPPTGHSVVVYPPVGTTGVQVWCAPVDPTGKNPGYSCFWTDASITCLVFDIDARTNIDAYRVAVELRADFK